MVSKSSPSEATAGQEEPEMMSYVEYPVVVISRKNSSFKWFQAASAAASAPRTSSDGLLLASTAASSHFFGRGPGGHLHDLIEDTTMNTHGPASCGSSHLYCTWNELARNSSLHDDGPPQQPQTEEEPKLQ